MDPGSFEWSGSLHEVPATKVLAHLRSLGVSALVQITGRDETLRLDVIAGEIAEPSAWRKLERVSSGSFRVAQVLPDFHGGLTTQREMRGDIADVSVAKLLRWIEETRLSAALTVHDAREAAVIECHGGLVGTVLVRGRPNLAALARIREWSAGIWHIRLMPLLSPQVLASVRSSFEAEDDGRLGTPFPATMQRLLTETRSLGGNGSPSVASHEPRVFPVPVAEDSAPFVIPSRSGIDVDVEPSLGGDTIPEPLGWVPPHIPAPAAAKRHHIAQLMGVAAGVALLAGIGAVVVMLTGREPQPSSVPPAPSPQSPSVTSLTPERPSPAAEAHAEPPIVAHEPASAPPDATALAQAARPSLEATPPPPPRTVEHAQHPRPPLAHRTRSEAAAQLTERARRALFDGNRKQALALLEQARKLDPDNLSIRVTMAQAHGKLGAAGLVIESWPKGMQAEVDGIRVGQTPVVLRAMPAGEHTVKVGESRQEVRLVAGKKKVVKFELGGSRPGAAEKKTP